MIPLGVNLNDGYFFKHPYPQYNLTYTFVCQGPSINHPTNSKSKIGDRCSRNSESIIVPFQNQFQPNSFSIDGCLAWTPSGMLKRNLRVSYTKHSVHPCWKNNQILFCIIKSDQDPITYLYCAWGHFKNTYELLNLKALKFSHANKIHMFQCMGKIFCVEFQRYPLIFHTKYLIHTLKDMIFIQHWHFKSS